MLSAIQVFKEDRKNVITIGSFTLYFMSLFLMLVGFVLFGVTLLSQTNSPILYGSSIAFLIIGVIACASGLPLRIEVDPKAKEISVSRPLRKHNKHLLSSIDEIAIGKELRLYGRTTTTVYPIRLRSGEGDDIDLVEFRDIMKARVVGERLAEITQKNLADSSTGRKVLRRHDEMNLPLTDKLQKLQEPVALPAVPTRYRLRVKTDSFSKIIEFGPRGINLDDYLWILFGGIIGSLFLFAVSAPIWLFITSFTVLVFWRLGLAYLLRESITVDRNALTRRWQMHLLLLSCETIPLDELEELVLVCMDYTEFVGDKTEYSVATFGRPDRVDKGIVARSDRKLMNIGDNQPNEEVNYAYLFIRNALS